MAKQVSIRASAGGKGKYCVFLSCSYQYFPLNISRTKPEHYIMPTGSCICGAIKISYTGEPTYTAICYCDDDRKMSGAQTFQVPKQNFTLVAGEPKVYTKVSDFGRVCLSLNHINNTPSFSFHRF